MKKLPGTDKGVFFSGNGQLVAWRRTLRKVSDRCVMGRKSQLPSLLVLQAEIRAREANFREVVCIGWDGLLSIFNNATE